MLRKRFKKLPIEIEAMQWNGDNTSDVLAWISPNEQELLDYEAPYWIISNSQFMSMHKAPDKNNKSLEISTPEGIMYASKNDWIICGIEGEFYPCKKEIFEKTYEEVSLHE